MEFEEIKTGQFYECMVRGRLVPVYVEDKTVYGPEPGVAATNLTTDRTLFTRPEQVKEVYRARISDIDQWWREKG